MERNKLDCVIQVGYDTRLVYQLLIMLDYSTHGGNERDKERMKGKHYSF